MEDDSRIANSLYRRLPDTRRDLGYEWQATDIQSTLDMLKLYLERVQARCFYQDVYASNNQVYRNILIQLPGVPAFPVAQDLSIRFNRDDGRQFNIALES